jgi:hypothetical protein
MLVGHIAAGLVAKRITPKISLGSAVMASLLPDLLWCIFLITGLEHVHFKPGRGAANYFDTSDIALSHSLLMDAMWAALFAASYFFLRRYARGAWILFAAVLSHWLLDFASHRPDMPLAPGVQKYFGLGLWTSLPATVLLEGGFWLLAIILYLRSTRTRRGAGPYVFWGMVALLTLAWYNNITGPPPPSPLAAGIASLIFFSLVVAWAYWMEKIRAARVGNSAKKNASGAS